MKKTLLALTINGTLFPTAVPQSAFKYYYNLIMTPVVHAVAD